MAHARDSRSFQVASRSVVIAIGMTVAIAFSAPKSPNAAVSVRANRSFRRPRAFSILLAFIR